MAGPAIPAALVAVVADHQTVLLEAFVTGEALLRRGGSRPLGMAVAGEALESPAAGTPETLRIFHHHVDAATRAFLQHRAIRAGLDPVDHDDRTIGKLAAAITGHRRLIGIDVMETPDVREGRVIGGHQLALDVRPAPIALWNRNGSRIAAAGSK